MFAQVVISSGKQTPMKIILEKSLINFDSKTACISSTLISSLNIFIKY